MLKITNAKIADCLAKAADARDRARSASHGDDKDFYFRMEGLWTRLAEAHAFAERIDGYLKSVPPRADN
jgi:hypothetical protein